MVNIKTTVYPVLNFYFSTKIPAKFNVQMAIILTISPNVVSNLVPQAII